MGPKEQCEELMNFVIPFARRMLVELGEFHPFGAYATETGEVVSVSVPGESVASNPEFNDGKLAIRTLETTFRRKAESRQIAASAIVFDVRVLPPGGARKCDAIQCNLDHRLDFSAEVFFPYSIVCGAVKYGKVFAQKGKDRIFGQGHRAGH